MTDLTKLTLADAVDGLKAKTFSSQELTQAFLTNIEASNPTLNAYIEVTADKAIEQARASDARLAKGEGGALEGAPLGIKDLFCTEGVQTTAASNMLRGFVPPYESTVTANLWRSEEHTSELQSRENLVCRLLLEKKKKTTHDQ